MCKHRHNNLFLAPNSFHVQGNVHFEVHQHHEGLTHQSPRDSNAEKDLQELLNVLKQNQKTRLEEICGEEDMFRQGVEIAPLQLSTKSLNYDELDLKGNFHHREEIVDMFTINTSEVISYTQIFTKAKLGASRRSANCSTEAATFKHTQRYGNHVFISGQAGIGKTVLSKVLVQEMLNPSIKLYETEFTFYIKFRDLNYEDKSDLLDFLTMYDSSFFCASAENKNKVLEFLQKCSNVCIVMDGLDEADIKSKTNHPKCNIFSKAKAATFIKSLFWGDLLPLAKIVTTSRPRQLAQLSNDILPQIYFIVNLLGLSEKGQQQICSNLCHDDAYQRDKILNYLNNHPDLKSYCYVPINAIVTMRILKETKEGEWRKLDSLTTILVTALNYWFLQKLSNFQAKEIADMAYEGFCQDRYHFKQWHFNKAGVNVKNLATFMINVKFFLFDGKEILFYFVHLMWQELFVAVKLSLFTDEKKLTEVISKLDDAKYEMVTKFLFGLCNENTQTELLGNIEAKDLNSSADRIKCKQLLKAVVITKIQDWDSRYYLNLAPMFQVFGWIHEMHDDDFTVQAANCLDSTFFIRNDVQILPTDIPSLNYMLRNRRTQMALEVDNPDYVGNSFQYFMKELEITLTINSNIQLKMLKFDTYGMEDSEICVMIKHIAQKIEHLNLGKVTKAALSLLATQIQGRSNAIKKLELHKISPDVDVATQLSLCIHNIEKLLLDGCKLKKLGFAAFADSIKQRNEPMEGLLFTDVWIEEHEVIQLSQCIGNIEHLNLDECCLTKKGIVSLANQIRERNYPMKKLELYEAPLADSWFEESSPSSRWHLNSDFVNECAEALMGCLHNIKELNLWFYNMLPETKTKLETQGSEVGCKVGLCEYKIAVTSSSYERTLCIDRLDYVNIIREDYVAVFVLEKSFPWSASEMFESLIEKMNIFLDTIWSSIGKFK